MILHRLRLKNFRGIADREITFPDRGVVVVCGPNEIGKSSMLEALDLLLEHKDRSAKQRVLQVKPTHADAGAEVEAEISTGPYRFVYRKRFHKKPVTELTVTAPAREQHSGDEAHDRVRAMLEETVDTKLWDAQRVLQSAATEAVDLSGSDALARALDAAAGEIDNAGGTESLLVDRIDAEYARYFTPATGKPAKEYRDAVGRLAALDGEAQHCRDLVADVEDRVRRHETLTATRAELTAARGPASVRRAAAEQAAADLTELGEQVAQARLVATAAAGTSSASQSAQQQRQKLVADAERRAATLTELQQGLDAAAADEATARLAVESADVAAAGAAERLLAAQQRADAARAAAAACSDGEEADRLDDRVARIAEAQAAAARVEAELAAITLTPAVLADIEQAAALMQRLTEQQRADAARVVLTPRADLEVTVDGEPLRLAADQDWTAPASSPVTVELPGVLSVRIDPGATAAGLHAQLQSAQRITGELLVQGGVADLATAREVDQRRRELDASRAQLSATLEGLSLGEDVDAMRARLAQLRANAPQPGLDAAAAAVELSAAIEALDAARAAADTAHQVAAAATAECAATCTAATLLRDRIQTAGTELAEVCGQLDQSRAGASDDDVAAAAVAGAAAAAAAEASLIALTERYEAANPAAVDAELIAARQADEAIAAELAEVERQLAALTAQLEVIGEEGRQGRLDEAEAELERARAVHDRVAERAIAVKLLRETMIRHRDSTRQRYVAPYRTELERLGRTVFGPTFEVEVGTNLTINRRTLAGCTVPYDSLSGGAKEQLGILARLAGAALVAAADTVPVVIDDALGFTDSDRLDRMGEVFSTVGDRGQVIVLTCQPDRYAGIADAEFIELSA